MKITRLDQVPQTPVTMKGVKDAYRQVPIGQSDGAPSFVVRVFTVAPGGHTPLHSHPFEHVNYVLEGRGEIMSDDGPQPLSRGDFVLVLPGERHQYRNPSDQPLVFMCMVPREHE